MSRTILVPIDVSESDLAQRVISHVELQASQDDASVHFLTVVPTFPYYASLGMAQSTQVPSLDELQQEALSKLHEIVTRFNLPEDRKQTHIAEGSPKDKILDLAKTLSADLIILASHRPDMSTWLLGSNAAAVVRHAECSVLVVR
ncbi:universal stress protein UspF [Superficieibacter sp.]|uniref:universal stress protein UspF n=1 Tax=Superficieibacter sp. TaxID=2303322 RepID=UPI0028AD512E|nr:universal stress protein UspF [Superficieibacter sp.]